MTPKGQRDAPPFEPKLATLVWPHDPATFVKRFWQKRSLFVRGSASRLGRLRRQLFDFDLEAILRRVDPSKVVPQSREPKRIPQARDHATLMQLHRDGVQLYIQAGSLPGIDRWVSSTATALAMLRPRGRGDLYATREGGGLDVHFDANDNFTIQLAGKKTWWFGAVPAVDRPVVNSPVIQHEGASYVPRGLEPATTQRRVTLRPGDMLYIPRGTWHSTHAEEESLSFDINIHPTPWAEVIFESLHLLTLRSRDWRGSALRDRAELEGALTSLKSVVAGLTPNDFLAPSSRRLPPDLRSALLRRNPLTAWRVEPTPERSGEVYLLIQHPMKSSGLVIPEAFVELLERVPEDGTVFTLEPLMASFSAASPGAVESFFGELLRTPLIAAVGRGCVAAPAHGRSRRRT